MRLPAELDGRFECNAKSLLHSVIETGQVTFKTVQEPCGSTTTQDLHVFVQQLRTLLHSQLFTGKGPLQLLELGFEFTGFRGQVVESGGNARSEEHTSKLQSRFDVVCRLLLEKNNPADYVIDKLERISSALPSFQKLFHGSGRALSIH